uniref:Cysteine rich with EGF like domains 2 n=1 Tax=Strix occidentalis caurina TaxID=311401 RepID=A0A8D0FRT0_STROC
CGSASARCSGTDSGLADTAKKNFGGGNTAWEEKTLSKYESSEIRLVEIIENLCDSSNFECNNMVEEHEEQYEVISFKSNLEVDFFEFFLACRGGSERPCHGNGHCDGDGTRGGDGSCSCNKEYTGDFCLDCSNGYFSTLRNETHSVCTGNEVFDTCLDLSCDASCIDCTGEGSDKCKTCASGYMKEDEKCTDIDECNLPEKVCMKENQDCVNTSGSYKCVCSEGFEEKDGTCVQTVKTGKFMRNCLA